VINTNSKAEMAISALLLVLITLMSSSCWGSLRELYRQTMKQVKYQLKRILYACMAAMFVKVPTEHCRCPGRALPPIPSQAAQTYFENLKII